MTDQTPAVVLNQRTRGVTEVVLNYPEKRNAFDDLIIRRLIDALEQVARDENTRVVIVRSEGKHFSAGADLSWMRRMAGNSREENLADARQLARLMSTLNQLPKPVIGLVQGAAFGGAVGLAACCDMVLATDNATFCLSEVKLGLIPATISPYVVRAIGERQARRYFLTAEVFTAAKAQELGLVHILCEDADALQSRCDELIEQLMMNGPSALAASKELIFAVSHQPITPELIEDTSKRIASIRVSDEGQEGLNAFLEKRNARWMPERAPEDED
ncbi:enoyl-CoA hydratase/isomerase family protein [Marinobacter confluentis]|uniref:Enoyl-CoA hydratase/isomerase family protein n=1 Tax=Marinobacter confluentis TaxID=1697557 RepID=A0A4Z1CG27_9GAMM|nr:enoyl-CoA hydratase/isomerase family protein [Marinobacter confluentis]TGN39204.1 enoyl-CoA hydratase/isomerase family protein [Marinobacter confluentis]